MTAQAVFVSAARLRRQISGIVPAKTAAVQSEKTGASDAGSKKRLDRFDFLS